MIPALLFLGFFSPCAEAGIITATSAQQSEIMEYVREGIKATEGAKVLELEMEAAKASDPEEWERLSWLENSQREKAAGVFDLAIKKTLEYYGIAPAGLQFEEAQAARQGPMTGTPIKWAPTVLDADHLYFQYTDANNRIRHGGGPFTHDTAGTTWEDGRVSIKISVLLDALNYDHPGLLALALHHEGQHFEEKVTRQEKTREESEMSAYKASLNAADIFEIGTLGPNASTTRNLPTKADLIATLKQVRFDNAAQLRDGFGRSVYLTPVEEAAAKDLFDIDQSELARIQEETMELREAAVRNRLEREERERRARQAEEAKRRVMAEYKAAAAGCGLTPIMIEGNKTIGFRADQAASVYFTDHKLTLDQAKATMLMTRACWAGEFGPPEEESCTDALGTMRANWADAEFKRGLEVEADAGNIDGCLRAIREDSHPPKDKRALNKRVSTYWRDWKVAAKRREIETRREIGRQREEAGRRARGDAEERSGRVPDQSYDLTPARRALEEARRSRF